MFNIYRMLFLAVRYSSWDMEWDKIFWHFGILGHFLPFYLPPPLTSQKTKIWKNETSGDAIISNLCISKLKLTKNVKNTLMLFFYTCEPQIKIMMYGSWDMSAKDKAFCHFCHEV